MSWRDEARCAGSWDLFDAPNKRAAEFAALLCLDCPVRRACDDLAREIEPTTGVWGGRRWKPAKTDAGARLHHGVPS